MTPELLSVFLDHIPGIISAIFGGILLLRSRKTRVMIQDGVEVSARSERAIKQVSHDLQNGVGEKIASKAVAEMTPALHEAASVAADKIVRKANEVATALAAGAAWDGVERRSGVKDRRQ